MAAYLKKIAYPQNKNNEIEIQKDQIMKSRKNSIILLCLVFVLPYLANSYTNTKDKAVLAGSDNIINPDKVDLTLNQEIFDDPEIFLNKDITEEESTYDELLSLAEKSLKSIREMADSMERNGEVKDHKYWFTRVYQYVTEGELSYVKNNAFQHPEYALRSIVYFEKIYRDNVNAIRANSSEKHWKKAFETIDEKKDDLWVDFMDAVECIVQSMLAHIRFDLSRAEAWVYNSYYRPKGMDITDFQSDFMSMQGIFDDAARRMNDDIYNKFSWVTKGLMLITPSMAQDLFMTYWYDANMASERADTWQRVEALVKNELAANDPYTIKGNKIYGNITKSDYETNLQKLGNGLAPNMKNGALLDDDDIRMQIRRSSKSKIANMAVSKRIRMLIGLMSGSTYNGDEAVIRKILNASRNSEIVTIVDAISAWSLFYALDGTDYKELRTLLRERYYGQTLKQTALNLMVKCMDGETAEWEEKMIVDILEARSEKDAHQLIVEIGQKYEGESGSYHTDYKKGINKLEWQLDGDEQKRLNKVFGYSD